ncbi:MinD/ParA family protein [Brevibacillus sp. SYSU BS000544]|uniref:MinD/ParA family protein n=1 Tax=Brevibacillus sp. SYSU BS000544 TaxID=3416443 RepID=UPI003CE4F546
MVHDQAEQLRERIQRTNQTRPTRLITVTSGKGGVGKSNFTLNFALGLIERGQKVLIFDVDLGLANLDVLMGVTSKNNLLHVIEKNKAIWELIEKGPNGLEYIAGGSGFTQILQLDDQKLNKLFDQLSTLQGYADTVFFDTGAGISNESLRFMLSSDEIILVTTPEPTSITDAYAVIKMIHSRNPQAQIKIIINRVSSSREGKATADKLTTVAKRFLNMDLQTLGFVPDDTNVMKAVKLQQPFLLAFPNTQASKGIRELVDQYIGTATIGKSFETTGFKGFLSRMKNMIR